MRSIASDFFANSPVMAGPLVAIVLFFMVFVGVAIWLIRSKRGAFDAVARLPLEDGATKEVCRG
jgi:cbb3-type cytochrome oxidase subunit 3